MTTPNSNRPILSLRPKVVIPPVVETVEATPVIETPAKAKKVTNAGTIRKLKKTIPAGVFWLKRKQIAAGLRHP